MIAFDTGLKYFLVQTDDILRPITLIRYSNSNGSTLKGYFISMRFHKK